MWSRSLDATLGPACALLLRNPGGKGKAIYGSNVLSPLLPPSSNLWHCFIGERGRRCQETLRCQKGPKNWEGVLLAVVSQVVSFLCSLLTRLSRCESGGGVGPPWHLSLQLMGGGKEQSSLPAACLGVHGVPSQPRARAEAAAGCLRPSLQGWVTPLSCCSVQPQPRFCVVVSCPRAPALHFSDISDRRSEPSRCPTARGSRRGGEGPDAHFQSQLSLSGALQRLELEGRCLCVPAAHPPSHLGVLRAAVPPHPVLLHCAASSSDVRQRGGQPGPCSCLEGALSPSLHIWSGPTALTHLLPAPMLLLGKSHCKKKKKKCILGGVLIYFLTQCVKCCLLGCHGCCLHLWFLSALFRFL